MNQQKYEIQIEYSLSPVVAVGSDQSVVADAAYFDGAGVETLVLTVACAATWIVEKLVHAAAFKTFQTCSNHS